MSKNNTVTTQAPTPSERFEAMVVRQYAADVGHVEMSDYERTLLQHCFIKCDMAFKEANAKKKNDNPPIEWANINMSKLALDAANRIKLGIDGLIPGHLYPIAYYNNATNLYDVDLRVGYMGEIFYKQKASMHPIHDIRFELVHETDEFTVYKKDMNNKIEGFIFRVNEPFKRGKVTGGYAYIEYEDETKNVLVVMSVEEINKRKPGNSDFWNKWPEEMQYKTVVHAAMKKINLDPEKINIEAANAVDIDDETVYVEEPPAGNGQEIALPKDYGQTVQHNLPPQQSAIPDPIVPEGYTVNQATPLPAREKAPAPRQNAQAQPQQQSMYQDDTPDFLRDMKGGSAKRDPF